MADAESILVLGHRGLLGQALVEALAGACQVIEAPRQAFDLASAKPLPRAPDKSKLPPPAQAEQAWASLEELRRAIPRLGSQAQSLHHRLDLVRRGVVERRPSLVINCIGFTDVDRAEAEPLAAYAVNATGAQAVAQACAQAGAQLIHVSTDFVFDGRAERPYREDDPPAPLSKYGYSKLLGERLVLKALPGALVVRTAWLFGPGRPTFVEAILAQARSGRQLRVVSDQVGSPTYTRDLARALLTLARRWVGGVLNVVNSGQASRYDMARSILSLAGLDPQVVKPISSAELGRPAQRPAYSVLDNSRACQVLGEPLPPWTQALERHMTGSKENRA